MERPSIDKFFNDFSYENIDSIDTFYSENAVFEDPLGAIKGRKNIKAYLGKLYKNVISIRFEFSKVIREGNEEVGLWTMYLKSKNLNGGEEFPLKGNTHIRYNSEGLAEYHCDYYDMGEFIYEQVPLLRNVIGLIKNKLKH